MNFAISSYNLQQNIKITNSFKEIFETEKKFNLIVVDNSMSIYGDEKYCEHFDSLLRSVNIEPMKLPPRSPNLNTYAERFILSVKSECLGRMILFGERSLYHVLKEYTEHYHFERNHQGIRNTLIFPQSATGECKDGAIKCQERLGGLLKFYHRGAA